MVYIHLKRVLEGINVGENEKIKTLELHTKTNKHTHTHTNHGSNKI